MIMINEIWKIIIVIIVMIYEELELETEAKYWRQRCQLLTNYRIKGNQRRKIRVDRRCYKQVRSLFFTAVEVRRRRGHARATTCRRPATTPTPSWPSDHLIPVPWSLSLHQINPISSMAHHARYSVHIHTDSTLTFWPRFNISLIWCSTGLWPLLRINGLGRITRLEWVFFWVVPRMAGDFNGEIKQCTPRWDRNIALPWKPVECCSVKPVPFFLLMDSIRRGVTTPDNDSHYSFMYRLVTSLSIFCVAYSPLCPTLYNALAIMLISVGILL